MKSDYLYGLILTGGESSRMGQPKFLLDYHGIPQVNFIAQLLDKYCNAVFISCSAEQSKHPAMTKTCIVDEIRYQQCGPLGGILSAYEKINGALLVVSCDYPFIAEADIKELVDLRNQDLYATVFIKPDQEFPEPFPGIYEQKSKQLLHEKFLLKEYSLRKFLSENEVQYVKPSRPGSLLSIDTPEAFIQAKRDLKKY